MFGHAASNPVGSASASASASAASRVSVSVDVADVVGDGGNAAVAADDTSFIDPRQQALNGAPSSHQPPPPPSESNAVLTSPTTRDDRRRSLPSDLTRPRRGGASTTTTVTTTAADRSNYLHGRSTTTTTRTGDDPLSAYRSSARRHLNATTTSSSVAHHPRTHRQQQQQQQQHRPSRSSSAAPPSSNGTAHPVIVRTYSGTPPLDHHRYHRHRVAAIREEEIAREMRPPPNLPPVEAFSFDDILKNVETEVGGALDAIAGICASCRYSPANHYDVHMPPHIHNNNNETESDDPINPTTTITHGQPYTSTIDPQGRGQHHVDLIESEYHTWNNQHHHTSSVHESHHSPMAFIESTRPTSLTALPAPEILTELRRTDERIRPGGNTNNTPRASMDDYRRPSRASIDFRRLGQEDISYGYDAAGSARRGGSRRSSSVLEHFAAWFPWGNSGGGHEHDTPDRRAGGGVDGLSQDGMYPPSAERQLRGLLAGRGTS
ncbi:MAG: hypothetical protein M1823_003044 [Watsoniomyces obsoletus]|nr:MAG: hypothetical protein M1823_003044 [Watsoniomyces obsoletus]